MTTITDNFPSNGSDLGANWTVAHVGSLAVVSNAANNSSATYLGNFHVTTLTNDHYVQAVIGGKASGTYFDVKLRGNGVEGNPGSRTGYQCSVGGTNEAYISLVGVGDLWSGTATFANGDVLRGEIEGTTIRLKINGSLVHELTNSSISSGGYVGIGIYGGGGTGSLDDFEAGDIASEPSSAEHGFQLPQAFYRRGTRFLLRSTLPMPRDVGPKVPTPFAPFYPPPMYTRQTPFMLRVAPPHFEFPEPEAPSGTQYVPLLAQRNVRHSGRH